MPALHIRARLGALKQRLRSRFVLFGTLRETYPVNPAFGLGKGTPIDRYYIDRFLDERRGFVTGRVLEIGDRTETQRYGTDVTVSDVLHVEEGNPVATIVGDLSDCPQIPSDTFDCIILLQTLHYVYDMEKAVAELHRILAPGGHLLCTVPGISQISRHDMDRWGDRWRLTTLSARELFATAFAPDDTDVVAYGNTLAALCFIEGITTEKLKRRELDAIHPDYELIVAIDAVKQAP